MTEDIHCRCNVCGEELVSEELVIAQDHSPEKWARVSVDLARFHYCPECWARILTRLGNLPLTP